MVLPHPIRGGAQRARERVASYPKRFEKRVTKGIKDKTVN